MTYSTRFSCAISSIILGLAISDPATAQIRTSGFQEPVLIQRIDRGDWVWSTRFPSTDARLLGYGIALLEAVRAQGCDQAGSAEENVFSASWILSGLVDGGSPGPNLTTTIDVATARSIAPAARADATHLLNSFGCSSIAARRVLVNASRMASGRRPGHGGENNRTQLAREMVNPVATRHMSSRTFASFSANPRLITLVEHDAGQASNMGFKVLECHYDTDPDDDYYHVQYYWAADAVVTIAQLTNALPLLVATAQRRLRQASPQAGRHPFLDYGPPRSECPPLPDIALETKRILAPAKPASNVPVAAAGEPVMTEHHTWFDYDYGAVPESFSPAIPAWRGKDLQIMMKKQQPGALVHVGLARPMPHHLDPVVMRRLDRAAFNLDTVQSNLVRDDLHTFQTTPDVLILSCGYQQDSRGRSGTVHRYWYRTRPAAAVPERLRARLADHPALVIRAPVDRCPVQPR